MGKYVLGWLLGIPAIVLVVDLFLHALRRLRGRPRCHRGVRRKDDRRLRSAASAVQSRAGRRSRRRGRWHWPSV